MPAGTTSSETSGLPAAVLLVCSDESVSSRLATALMDRRVEAVILNGSRLDELDRASIPQFQDRIGTVVTVGAVGSIAGFRPPSAAGFADTVAAVLKPVFLGTKLGVGHLARAGGGAIVNIVGAIDPAAAAPDNMIREAARGAAANLSRSAALHAGKSGYRVRVNSLYLPILPRSAAEASALAETIIYLGSAEAEFVTGIELALTAADPA